MEKEFGQSVYNENVKQHEQIDMFDLLEETDESEKSAIGKVFRYIPVSILNWPGKKTSSQLIQMTLPYPMTI